MEKLIESLETSLRKRRHLLGGRRRCETHGLGGAIGNEERVPEHLKTPQSSRRCGKRRNRLGDRKEDSRVEAGDGHRGRYRYRCMSEEHGTALRRARDWRRVGCVPLVGIGCSIATRALVAAARGDVDAFPVGTKASRAGRHAITLQVLASLLVGDHGHVSIGPWLFTKG